MAKLVTPVPLPEYPFHLAHQQGVLTMGSCFAEHIGEYLAERKFKQLLNPFGIVYHPLVLAGLLEQLIKDQPPQSADLFQQQGLWRHYDFHSRFAHHDREQAWRIIQQQHAAGRKAVRELDLLILTFGTAYGYQLQSSGAWVNNCHKQAAATFAKKLATVESITTALTPVLNQLKTLNPSLQVILTVSPVRHLRDGLLENQRSKARLLLSQQALCDELEFVHYFPSYEILLDELRDYRYYADDLLHPSRLAVEIITERFAAALFSPITKQLAEEISRLVRSSKHRPLHPQSEAAEQFVQQTLMKMDALNDQYSWLDFSSEKKRLLQAINSGLPGA